MSKIIGNLCNSLTTAGRCGGYGMAVGYAAAYLATTLKIVKSLNPMSWAVGVAAGLATKTLAEFFLNKIDSLQRTNFWIYELIYQVAVPLISILAGIWLSTYATPIVFTSCVAASAALIVATLAFGQTKSNQPIQVTVRTF